MKMLPFLGGVLTAALPAGLIFFVAKMNDEKKPIAPAAMEAKSDMKVEPPKVAPKEEPKMNEQAEKVLALVRAAKLPNLRNWTLVFGKVRVSEGVSGDRLDVSISLDGPSWATLSDSWDDASKRTVLAAVKVKIKELEEIRDNGDTRKGAAILMATDP